MSGGKRLILNSGEGILEIDKDVSEHSRPVSCDVTRQFSSSLSPSTLQTSLNFLV